MTPPDPDEYDALRATIRERGTARVWIAAAGIAAWGLAALLAAALAATPLLTLIPLVMLAASFEIVFALHTGVERVGRYIQVFFEEEAGRGGWERRIMEFGRASDRRWSTDPLFVRSFGLAGAANLLSAIVASPSVAEWLVLAVAHALLGWRMRAARRLAAGQRAADLTRFRDLRNAERSG